MDVRQEDSKASTTHQEAEMQSNSFIELEAQMASLLSLHSVTSDLTMPTPDALSINQSATDIYTVPDNTFVSVIKFNGQPIPPPVLSLACRLEMQSYKEEAMKKEQEIVARRRRKLLDTVQDIVDRYEVRKQESRESTPRWESETTELTQTNNATLPALSNTEKWHYNQAIQAIEDKENQETCEQEAANILQEIDSMLDTKLNINDDATNEINPPDSIHRSESTRQSLNPPETKVIPPSISSSVSSGEGSALNTTVIAAADGVDHETEPLKVDIGQGFQPPFQSTAVGFYKHTESAEHCLNQEASTLDKDRVKVSDILRDSWAESESNLSFLGEYQGLPTPISFENQDSSNTQEKSQQIQSNFESKSSEYNPANYQLLPAEDKEMSTLSTSRTLSGTHSMQLTLDTVGQSCTLPLSLFSSSSNSTLCEVQDPFASYTDVTIPLGEEDGGLVRGAPVGQESSNTESGSKPQVVTNTNTDAISISKSHDQNEIKHTKSDVEGTSADEYKSPPKRVRRNSYTLDHPSPALLDAQARNEAPYASDEGSPQVEVDIKPGARRSLELGDTEQSGTSKRKQITSEEQKKDGSTGLTSGDVQKGAPVLTEDNLLRLQIEQFEQMRKQLEQKQREQIEEMLLKQQQEQVALQKEMTALELMRFNQQDSSKIYSSVFGMEELSVDDDGQRPDEDSQNPILIREKRSSETTNPSLRDSLESALPPTILPISHTSPAIHTHSPQLSTLNTSYSQVSETADSHSVPFYLEHSHNRSIDLDYMDVEKSALNAWTPASDVTKQKVFSPGMQAKFERVSAAVKGYLTRRLMRTHKVQSIIQTIRDTVYFVDDFQAETPIKQGRLTPQDVQLAERLLSQLSTARNELYDTFQTISPRDRMTIIAQSRVLEQQELRKTYDKSPSSYVSSRSTPVETKPLSAATLKALERKNKTKKFEDLALNATKQPIRTTSQRPMKRPKSVGGNRILRPIQGNQSPPSPIGAPFSFQFLTSKDPPKPKAVIHRQPGTNKASKPKSKPSTNTTTSTTTTGKKSKSARRSLYPANTGTTKGPAKGNARTKVTRNTVLNKK